MNSALASNQWLPLFMVLFISIFVSATQLKIPRLGVLHETILQETNRSTSNLNVVSKDLKTYFYTQTLDHFNYRPQSYATFKQRYLINFKHWGGANTSAPILVYLGAEAALDGDIGFIGFLSDNADRFKAMMVYIEHRYYGESIPFVSRKEAMKNASTRGYFNSAQAIADYVQIIIHIKRKYKAEDSPVIVVGGSYGGMLASWLRLKYPHVALGALASSAPVLYFDDITPQDGYYAIVEKDFRETSKNCYETIRKSWSEIDRVVSEPNGLSFLTNKFKTCFPINASSELKDYLQTTYAEAAQYNAPPAYPVTMICDGMDRSASDDILSRVYAGLAAYRVNRTCYDTNYYNYPSETSDGWSWPVCSELVIPIGIDSNVTMFPSSPFNLGEFIKSCQSYYGVTPRPHWITTHYGGHDMKLILRRFASNIIFSNGLKDPYSSGGVLKNISKSVVAVTTVNGSHCLDILKAKQSDPEWLVMQRNSEVKIIKGWISKYYKDLVANKKEIEG